jgi:hypothetical protein
LEIGALSKLGVNADVTLCPEKSHSHVTVPPTVTRASEGENDDACTFTVTAGDGGGGGPGGGGGGGAGGGLTPVLSLPPHASISRSNPTEARMLYDARCE